MNPHSKHRPLFFTPRSPWGGRLKNQSFRRHMRASEDAPKKPGSLPTIAGNNVPGSLQSQITPERAAEIMNPTTQPPLSARPGPSLKDAPYQPQPPQASQPSNGTGDLVRPQPHAQQTLTPGNADKLWEKKKPEKNLLDNPLNLNGVKVNPSINPHGGAVQIEVPWDKIFNRK